MQTMAARKKWLEIHFDHIPAEKKVDFLDKVFMQLTITVKYWPRRRGEEIHD